METSNDNSSTVPVRVFRKTAKTEAADLFIAEPSLVSTFFVVSAGEEGVYSRGHATHYRNSHAPWLT